MHEAGAEQLRWMRTLACRAYWTALEGRPGAVHLNFPLREPLVSEEPLPEDASGRRDGAPYVRRARRRRAGARQRRPRRAARAGRRARAAACSSPGATSAQTPLGEAAARSRRPPAGRCWPTRCRARAAARPRSPTTTRCCATSRSRRRCAPDLVLRVGDLPVSKPLRSWLAGLDGVPPGGARPRGRLAGPGVGARRLARARAGGGARAAQRLARRRGRERGSRGRRRGLAGELAQRRRARRRGDRRRRSASGELSEPAVAAELGVLLPEEATLFVASSMPVRDIETFWPVRADPPRVLCNRGANGIDGTVSSAFGAAADGRRPGRAADRRRRARATTSAACWPRTRLGAEADDRAARQRRRRHLRLPAGLGASMARPSTAAAAGDRPPRREDIYTRHIATPTGLDFAKAAALYGLGARARRHDLASFRAALERALAPAAGSSIVRGAQRARRATSSCTAASGAGASSARAQPASSGSSACSLISVSASSRGGVGVAHDAVAGVAAGDVAAQQRAAQRDAEFAVAGGVGPADGAGVPAAVEALERRDQRRGARQRLAADGRRRVHQPGQLERVDRRRQLRADRRGEVLDVGDPHELGLGRGGDPDRVRAQRALDPPRDDRVLLAVARVAQQLLAEVVVDGRVGAAAGRAGERERAHAVALAAHQQLGAGGDQRRVAAPDAEHEARRELLAQHAEHRRRVVRRAARAPALRARARSSRARPARDQLDGARDGLLVVLGRHRAGDLEAPGRAPGRAAAAAASRSSARRALQAREQLLGDVVGRRRARPASAARARSPPRCAARRARPRARSATPARSRASAARAPPSGANAKPPTATGPPPAGSSAGSATAAARQRAPALGDAWRSAPRRPPARLERLAQRRRAPRGRGRAARTRTSARPGAARRTRRPTGSTSSASAQRDRRQHRRCRCAARACARRSAQAARASALTLLVRRPTPASCAEPRGRASAILALAHARSRCAPARSRSRPCASSRSARTDAPSSRTPRSSRSCRSPR